MGEEKKTDCDRQLYEKTNDFPVAELLPENAWKALRLLERERRLLQAMIDGARNYHLVYLDRDFNFVHVNEAYAKTCGYMPNELVGKNHFDLYPDKENEAIFVSVRDSGIAVEFHDKPFVFPDQPERGITYWDWTLSPVMDAAGIVEGLVFSLFERTKRRRAEEALRESEKRFHRLFENDLTGDFLSEPGGKIILCNPAFATIFGFSSPEEAVGTNMLELYVQPEERDLILETLKRQGKLQDYEAWRKRRDGTQIHIIENLVGHFTDQGKLYEIQGYIFDDTERKQAEAALLESKELFEKTFIGQLDAIFLLDASIPPKIIDCNPAAVKMFGYDREEMSRLTTVTLHVNEEALNRFQKKLYLEMEERGFLQLSDFEMKRKDGENFPTEQSVIPLKDDKGRPTGWISVVRDISKRKEVEEALRRSRDELELRVEERTADLERANIKLIRYNKRLEALNKELQLFTSIASHDLQEPLRKIQTFGDMLVANTKGSLDEDSADYVQRMQKATIRMRKLLDSLLAYSRVSSLTETKKQTSLNKAVEAARSNLEMIIREKEAVIEIENLPVISADHFQMIQLFQNLIGNALKYQRHDEIPQVRIYLQKSGSERSETCNVCVTDNGIGIDAKYFGQIFLPFQRLHGRSEYSGVGMGLSICKKIVERHGGRMTLTSEPGKGSTFVISLPVE